MDGTTADGTTMDGTTMNGTTMNGTGYQNFQIRLLILDLAIVAALKRLPRPIVEFVRLSRR